MELSMGSVALPTNRASSGSASVTVYGASVGLTAFSGAVRVGGTSCESTTWEADTSVRCQAGQGVMQSLKVFVTSGGAGRSVTRAFSVGLAALSVVRGTNRAGTGSASVTVQGANLGLTTYTGSARSGGSACERTTWGSDTAVRCEVAHGNFNSRRISVTIGIVHGSVSFAFSSDKIHSSLVLRSNGPATTGSSSVTLHGSNFGLVSFSGSSRLGFSACERSAWQSDTSLRCQRAQGTGGSRRVSLTVGVRAGTVTYAVSMGDPLVASSAMRANAGSTGSTSLTILGLGFGLTSFTGSLRLGSSACERTTWEADTATRVRTAKGICASRPVRLTVGLQGGSLTFVVSIDLASLTVARRLNAASSGSASITLHGAGLGLSGSFTTAVVVRHTDGERTTWESDTSTRCAVGGGLGG
eukprot:CAMPEP_0113682728 /NCGR_PEP_ID=MMETSP0038_2-20120614/12847_1 /TAXON_ID=2898 /ORGANISM="Cryptomonas paramecium" /LENGTH=413 /DNA_ID=CAMNT_0000601875 /DNA_START=45 /DNA_END=1283 /DNA_ORIENTATION=+ /assembly_acc=CAM_ASM_000170